MNRTAARPPHAGRPAAIRHEPMVYVLFLVQLAIVFGLILVGNQLAARLNVAPAMVFVWTVLGLVIVVMLGLVMGRMEESSAGRRGAATQASGPGFWLGVATSRPLIAFPLALIVGTAIAALCALAVPSPEPLIALLWAYELVGFPISLVPLYLAASRRRDLFAFLSLYLGFALGATCGLLVTRPEENNPIYTALGWLLSLGLASALFRFGPFRRIVGDYSDTVGELLGRK